MCGFLEKKTLQSVSYNLFGLYLYSIYIEYLRHKHAPYAEYIDHAYRANSITITDFRSTFQMLSM